MEFQAGNHTYRVKTIDLFTQLHIVRRVLPILPSFMKAVGGMAIVGKDFGKMLDHADALFLPFFTEFSAIPDADVNYIITNCLSACDRKINDTTYSPVMTQGQFMFNDMDLKEMVMIVWSVIKGKLADFFPGAVKVSTKEVVM